MKKVLTQLAIAIILVGGLATVFAFSNSKEDSPVEGGEVMQITTIESIIPGGLGRSRMFITSPTGKMEEFKMKNFYSMVGINMGNINENDVIIVNKLNEYLKDGWQIEHVVTGVQSPSTGPNGGKGEGVYMTRYLLKK